MKVKFTDKLAPREGDEADVTDAAARRLVDSGYAEQVSSTKAESKSEPAKKPAKKAARKS